MKPLLPPSMATFPSFETLTVGIGLFTRNGGAVAAIVGGTPSNPALVAAHELTIVNTPPAPGLGPYHATKGLPWPQALEVAEPAVRRIRSEAMRELDALLADCARTRLDVRGLCIVGPHGRRGPAGIGNSEIRARVAEAELFRAVWQDAASLRALPYRVISAERLPIEAGETLRYTKAAMLRQTAAFGAAFPQWRKEERLASTAAWMALAVAAPAEQAQAMVAAPPARHARVAAPDLA
jgi:hypothetical protein